MPLWHNFHDYVGNPLVSCLCVLSYIPERVSVFERVALFLFLLQQNTGLNLILGLKSQRGTVLRSVAISPAGLYERGFLTVGHLAGAKDKGDSCSLESNYMLGKVLTSYLLNRKIEMSNSTCGP